MRAEQRGGLWIVWLAAVVFGCSGSPNRARLSNPSIAVIDRGAEPRQRLRYEPQVRVPERMQMSLKTRVNTDFTNTVLETGHLSTDFPTTTITVRVEVREIDGSDGALVSCELEAPVVLDDVVDPSIRRGVEAEVALLGGLRGSWRMSPSGTASAAVFEAPNAPNTVHARISAIGDSIRDASIVFPDEPIGVGATWQVASRQSLFGVLWDRTATYSLRELAGTTATVDASVVMRAGPQALSVEPNASTKLTSGTSNATAQVVVPLRRLVATTTSRGTSEMNLSIVRGRLRITTTVKTETFFSVSPSAPSSAHAPSPGLLTR